jgi:hypothetical protein
MPERLGHSRFIRRTFRNAAAQAALSHREAHSAWRERSEGKKVPAMETRFTFPAFLPSSLNSLISRWKSEARRCRLAESCGPRYDQRQSETREIAR